MLVVSYELKIGEHPFAYFWKPASQVANQIMIVGHGQFRRSYMSPLDKGGPQACRPPRNVYSGLPFVGLDQFTHVKSQCSRPPIDGSQPYPSRGECLRD
jgi:hypothetical protein